MYIINICNYNLLGIVFRKRLFIHMKHRHLRSASLCPICGTAIHSEKALQNHIDVVHGDRQRKYICDLCGKKFTCKSNLTSHLRLTHNEKKERCKFCNEVFKLKQTLYSHIVSVHIKARPYKCRHCEYSASQPSRIYEHCRTNHKLGGGKSNLEMIQTEVDRIREFEIQYGINRKPVPIRAHDYHCWLCGMEFLGKSGLLSHEWAHLDLRPYYCNHCDSKYRTKYALQGHIEKIHGIKVKCKEIRENDEIYNLYERARQIKSNRIEKYKDLYQEKPSLATTYSSNNEISGGDPESGLAVTTEDGKPIKKENENEDHFNTTNDVSSSNSYSYPSASNLEGGEDPARTIDEEGSGDQGNTGKYMKYSSGHPYKCKCCDSGFFSNLAEFYIHFDCFHRDQVQVNDDTEESDLNSDSNVQYGNYYNSSSGLQHPVAVQPNQFKHKCKCCGFDTVSENVLERHIREVHGLTEQQYEAYIPPEIKSVPKVFRPRKYRCRYCLTYTAVKKFTVHRHIRNTHEIKETFEGDVLLISDYNLHLQQPSSTQHPQQQIQHQSGHAPVPVPGLPTESHQQQHHQHQQQQQHQQQSQQHHNQQINSQHQPPLLQQSHHHPSLSPLPHASQHLQQQQQHHAQQLHALAAAQSHIAAHHSQSLHNHLAHLTHHR